MGKLIKTVLYELWTDEAAARRWIRGLLLWAGTTMSAVVAAGFDLASHWTLREWALRLGVSGIVGIAGLVSVGEPTSPAKVAAAVAASELAKGG